MKYKLYTQTGANLIKIKGMFRDGNRYINFKASGYNDLPEAIRALNLHKNIWPKIQVVVMEYPQCKIVHYE